MVQNAIRANVKQTDKNKYSWFGTSMLMYNIARHWNSKWCNKSKRKTNSQKQIRPLSLNEYYSQINIAMYKIVNDICPDNLKNHIAYTSEFNSRDTRSSTSVQFYIPKPNCELLRRSFMYSGAAIWNGVPCDVKAAIIANSFKSRYLKWRKLRN